MSDRMPHVFHAMVNLPQSRAAVDHIMKFIRQHAGWQPRVTAHEYETLHQAISI